MDNHDTSSLASTASDSPVVRRGYIDGCFDIMHSGHYNAIRQAKAQCDVLVVGIHSDDEIASNKAPPVMKQEERYELLKHVKWIDEILHDVPYAPSLKTLARAKADFCVHGDDMPVDSTGRGAYDDLRDAGKLRVIKRTEGVSTTDLVGRLLLLTKDHLQGSQLDSGLAPKDRSCVSVRMLTTTRRIAEFSSRRAPTSDDTVVYVDGAFDMFNVGHATTLQKAKALGTYLLVGIFDDETVNSMKGSNYPVMNLLERVLNVSACKHVDEVIIGAPVEITEDLIKTMNISIVAQGSISSRRPRCPSSDEEGSVTQTNEVAKRLGILHEVESDYPHLTAAAIAERIANNRLTYIHRNTKRDALEKEYYSSKQHIAEKVCCHLAQCDVLIIGVYADESIVPDKALPVMKQDERYTFLKHLKWVDEIVYGVPVVPTTEFLDSINADFCIHGDNMPVNGEGRCAYDDLRDAGRLRVFKRTECVTVTDLVGRLLVQTRDHLTGPRLDDGLDSETRQILSAPGSPICRANDLAINSAVSSPRMATSPTNSRKVLVTNMIKRISEFTTRRPPKPDDVIVYIDGAFDMFNVGHASTLEKAKALGTYLIVGVFDDRTVNRMKGCNYPVMNLGERVLNVSACKHVDDAVIGAPLEFKEPKVLPRTVGFANKCFSALHPSSEVPSDEHGVRQKNDVPKKLGIFKEVESDFPELTVTTIAERISHNRLSYIAEKRNRAKSLE
ncbi:Ethanolamine-phosphate cytidylyltransferase [Perkinsus chesapeaki]|uniref:ethanolamine-phosphate cytidylyltransferase n=1 Tax=Perkinsus chesapeaki TaxID=330153 RepID=A0A7J6LS33_PERCH|nr:Ethanolamine-phosphate cytidylyltransferase [Perkinsus chesapeaki]